MTMMPLLFATLLFAVCHAQNDGPFTPEPKSITNYLNPKLFEDPTTIKKISEKLQHDNVVVIRNAFVPEFAEAMYRELDQIGDWALNEGAAGDGFHYSHHNIYRKSDWNDFMNGTLAVFEHPDTKQWIADLSGRDCFGDASNSAGSPSYYHPGDHSLPHTDHVSQRTVAYVWHLSKNWRPEWGGALYWIAERDIEKALVHASFNTLVLFNVRPTSLHFVTTVSPHATEKRLAYNGWWESAWTPSLEDDLESILETPEKRQLITDAQYFDIVGLIGSNQLPPKRQRKLESLFSQMYNEFYPEFPQKTLSIDFSTYEQ